MPLRKPLHKFFQAYEQSATTGTNYRIWGGGDATALTVPSVHLAVLPLQLGEAQGDVGVRRLHVDDPVPGEAARRVAGAAEDRRVGDRRGHLPPELPRRDRQLPRPPSMPRRRDARTHGYARAWIIYQATKKQKLHLAESATLKK